MNDFTKEELENLLSTIGNMRIYSGIENRDDDLYIKIQSMIDNYCDHKEQYEDLDYISVRCKICMNIVNDS